MTARLIAPPAQPSGGRLADLATAAAARRTANRQRAEYLSSVATGLLSVHDVISAACTTEGAALRRIALAQLLGAQPDWGRTKVRDAMTHLRTIGGEPHDLGRVTVGWLVDPRARGARLLAFVDSTVPDPGPPWPGFPFAPQPPA